MLKGIDITLYTKIQAGEDGFHDPVYEKTPVTVHNVLVGEPLPRRSPPNCSSPGGGWPIRWLSPRATPTTGRTQRWSSSVRPSAPAAVLCRASRA